MNYVADLSAAIELFRELVETGLDHPQQVSLAQSRAEDNIVAQRLLDLLEDQAVSLPNFSHPAEFAPVDKSRRLTNYVEFTSYVKRNEGKPLNPETINFYFRQIDRVEWEMYAEILGNRFSLLPIKEVQAAPAQVVAKQQPKQSSRKQKNKNTRQAGK